MTATRDGKEYDDCIWRIEPDDELLREQVYFAESANWNHFVGGKCRIAAADNPKLNGHSVTVTVLSPDEKSRDSVVIKVVDA